MKSSAHPQAQPTPTDRLRKQIEKATAEGLGLDDMVLRLTHRDVDYLRRDRSLAVADISFSDGTMRFLGVRIEAGGLEASELLRSK